MRSRNDPDASSRPAGCSVASPTRAAARTWGRWLMTATASSCSAADIRTGLAPSVPITDSRSSRSDAPAPSVITTQAAPRNNDGEAAAGPDTSRPAIGWPDTKWARPAPASMIPAFTPATSVTSAPVSSPARSAGTDEGGPASTTRSAPCTAAAASSTTAPYEPRSATASRTAGEGSQPTVAHPASARPRATDVPMSPVPRTATRSVTCSLPLPGRCGAARP